MEDEYLALSGIQHFMFCRRQWALIHMERQWQENYLTAEGRLLHEHADDSFSFEKRKGTILTRGLPVVSDRLGLYGVCDVVEYEKTEQGRGITVAGRRGYYIPAPVEYKRGKPKEEDCDRYQLCAQAMCLQEMAGIEIKSGYLYYAQTHRREAVLFSEELKENVTRAAAEMQRMFRNKEIPGCKPEKKCKACSLWDICMPIEQQEEIGVYLMWEEP